MNYLYNKDSISKFNCCNTKKFFNLKIFSNKKNSTQRSNILIVNGAPSTDYFKLINDITTRYHKKEDIINAYLTLLKSEPRFSYIFESA